MKSFLPQEGEGAKRNKYISKKLKRERKKISSEIKLLLVGTMGSGKSTIFQQMKIIHQAGFTGDERVAYKSIIFMNLIAAMKALLTAAQKMMLPLQSSHIEAGNRITGFGEEIKGPLTHQQLQDLMDLWSDIAIQTAYKRSNEFQLNDSAAYYLDAIRRIGDKGWIPNDQDILHSQVRTTGMIEMEFTVGDVHVRMLDVGGARSERKKWIHCFKDVTALVFCVAMSEYDLKLFEDDTTNRMLESLLLFKEICNMQWFERSAIILFLNKKDLFEEKITRVPLSVCFPEYRGGRDYATSLAYITHQFLAQNQTQKSIYPHVISATDTPNVGLVFKAVMDIVLRGALDPAGIL